MENDLVLTLSQEELLYILKVLGKGSVPGIGPEMFSGATERDIAVAVSVTGRVLIARGLVIPISDGKVRISELVLALVGTCVTPKFSIVVELTTNDDSRKSYWHGVDKLIVNHSLPTRGIHQFRALKETNNLVKAEFDPQLRLVEEAESVFLHITLEDSQRTLNNPLVTTSLLGRAKLSNAAYENPDGTPFKIDTDYLGKKRNEANPSAGPFENPGQGKLSLKVW